MKSWTIVAALAAVAVLVTGRTLEAEDVPMALELDLNFVEQEIEMLVKGIEFHDEIESIELKKKKKSKKSGGSIGLFGAICLICCCLPIYLILRCLGYIKPKKNKDKKHDHDDGYRKVSSSEAPAYHQQMTYAQQPQVYDPNQMYAQQQNAQMMTPGQQQQQYQQ